MVNEAYLNHLNAGLPVRSGQCEVSEVDRFHPCGLRVDHQRAHRERDAVGNAALLGVQPGEPGLAREPIGQRPLSKLEQEQRQRAAEQRGVEQEVHQRCDAEPERDGGCDLRVAAADPAHRKAGEGPGEDKRAGADMVQHVVRCHATGNGEREEARDQRQRHAVRDGHREEIARCGERHQGRKEQKAREVEDHGLRLEAWCVAGSGRRRMLAGSAKQTDNGGRALESDLAGRGSHQMLAMRAASATVASSSARQTQYVGASVRAAPPGSPQTRHRFCIYATPLELAVSKKTKAPEIRGFCRRASVAYFSDELIEPNLVFSVLPRLLTTVMMASAMPAAIRPYSMAVAPDSSFTKRAIRFFMN